MTPRPTINPLLPAGSSFAEGGCGIRCYRDKGNRWRAGPVTFVGTDHLLAQILECQMG